MRFEELDLPVGKTLRVTIVGLDYKRHKSNAELVGYKRGKSIIVYLQEKPPQVLLRDTLPVQVEMELPTGTASFESEIYSFAEYPFLSLQLDYPAGVKFQQLRRDIRVPVDANVEIVGHTNIGMTTDAIFGHVLDISYSGARLVTEKELTSMVTKVSLGVFLSEGGIARDMDLTAEIRNQAELSPDYPDCGFAYGVELIDLDETDALFLRAVCLQKIQQQRYLLVAPEAK